MRSEATPYLVTQGQSATALERVKMSDREINEGFLQQLLDENPGIVPVAEFDESFGPIASLGREIMGIDNLFISPNGRPTLVEAKLWRNPQATRQVLAQVLEYASRLAALDYEQFEQRCSSANRSTVAASKGLYRFVAEAFPDEAGDEAEFIDRLQKNLRNGRFLLLVVGDGIREGLESILDALHHQSRLHFTFGLVELRLYRQPKGEGIIAVPHIVAHSTEIERAVVTIRGAASAEIQVEVRSDPTSQAPRLSEQEFLDSMQDPATRNFGHRLFDWAREHARIEVAKNGKSAVVRLPFSTTRTGLILIRLFKDGRVLLTPPLLRKALSRAEGGEEEVFRLANALQEIVPGLQLQSEKMRILPVLPASNLLPHADQILEIYTETIKRLETIDPELLSEEAGEDGDLE